MFEKFNLGDDTYKIDLYVVGKQSENSIVNKSLFSYRNLIYLNFFFILVTCLSKAFTDGHPTFQWWPIPMYTLAALIGLGGLF